MFNPASYKPSEYGAYANQPSLGDWPRNGLV